MELAASDVRMPQTLSVDGVDRLGHGTCPDESGIGVGVIPAFDAVPRALGGPAATGSIQVDLAGPTIARIEIAWTVPFTCSGPQQAEGSSTLTLFPNGRIVRHDVVTPSSTTLSLDGADCGCGIPSSFTLSELWTFTPGTAVLGDGSPWVDGSQAGCFVSPTGLVGVSWPDTTTRVHATSAITSFAFDWVAGASTLRPDQQSATSAILLSHATDASACGAAIADLDDFDFDLAGVSIKTDDSGIYVDSRPHTDPVVITTPQALPRGFAISLVIGEAATIERSPAPPDAAWYAVQPDGASSILWFRDGLQPGESITITPR
jgi:hypothetical protein